MVHAASFSPAFPIVLVNAASFSPAFSIVCSPVDVVFYIDTHAQSVKCACLFHIHIPGSIPSIHKRIQTNPPGVDPWDRMMHIYIYIYIYRQTQADIQPPCCMINCLALRRSAIIHTGFTWGIRSSVNPFLFLYTVFPRIEARASISFPRFLTQPLNEAGIY